MNIKTLMLTAFLFLMAVLSAQPDIELHEYQQKYPNVQTVSPIIEVVLHVEMDDGELKLYQDRRKEVFYLQEEAGHMKDVSIGFSSFSEITDLNPVIFLPGKKSYKKVKVKEFKTSDDASAGIFHDDSKSINFTYPGLHMGCKTLLQYSRIIKDPYFLNKVYLAWFQPIEQMRFKAIVDDGIEMGFIVKNEPEGVSYSEVNEDGKTIYTWEVSNVKQLKTESKSPHISYYTHHIIPYVKSYVSNGNRKEMLNDVAGLFNWYNGFVKNINVEKDDPVIRAIVDSIITGDEPEIEKVRKVFYWTQDNVKYIAYEVGMGGFVPREASYVCSNRYGDCKDMASTIIQLLDYAGIKGYYTWLGTNDIPYKYDEVPTPVTDNHMIATYIDGQGVKYYLDATGRYTPFGVPSPSIQGKQALIKTGENEFEIAEVPIVPANQNKFKDSVTISLSGPEITGHAVTTLGGYYKSEFEYVTDDLDDKVRKQLFKAYLNLGNNKFLLDDFEESNGYPNQGPLAIKYNFSIRDYAMQNGDELYINMNLKDILTGEKIDKKRETPIQNEYLSSYECSIILDIPEGYELDYFPEPVNIKNKYFNFKSNYKYENNRLTYHMVTEMDYLNLSNKDDFKIWNEGNGQALRASKEVIILKLKK
jgi:transglutaminase-like putative cysteine protease